MNILQPRDSKRKSPNLINHYQVLPLQSDIEKMIEFLGSRRIDDPAKVAFLAMVCELVPPCWNYDKPKTYNQTVLAWHVAQLKYIARVAGFKIARWASVRYTLMSLQYRHFELWNRGGELYIAYLQKTTVQP